MEAIEFLKEYKRMCESMISGCDACPMSIENNMHNVACSYFLKNYPEDTYKIVEQWSKEHPIITNAKKFEEIFGVKPENAEVPYRGRSFPNWWDEPYKESDNA